MDQVIEVYLYNYEQADVHLQLTPTMKYITFRRLFHNTSYFTTMRKYITGFKGFGM